jgi:hypothetical protein
MKNNLKLSLFYTSLFLILLGMEAEGQSFTAYQWKTLECTGEPAARHEAAFIEANGMFYLMGGRRIQEVSIFNPGTSTWSSGAKPPVELHHFEGFSYKGDIYAVGVQTGKYPHEVSLAETYVYKPISDTWEKSFNMPENRVRASTSANVYKDKLYIACGIIDGHWDGHVTWFDCYDFKTGKWEKLPDAPRYRDHACSVICNDKLYLLGGRVTSASIGKVFELTVPEIDVYDFKKGKWSTLDFPVPTQRAGCTAICIGDKIIFTGGETSDQKLAHKEVECLDTKTMEWYTLPSLNTGRHGTQLIWHKRKLYIASGSGQMGGRPELTSIECFKK